MSWNNNGNNGSRDPWGGKDGPPDIDEALKNLEINSVFYLEENLALVAVILNQENFLHLS
jgi:hypothetical protein